MRRHRLARFAAVFAVSAVVLAGCGGSKPSEDVKLGGIALTDVLDGLLTRANRALGGIQSLETAQAAVPELHVVNDDFVDLRFHAPKLSPAGQDELAKRARQHQPELHGMVRAVQESPALAEIMGTEMEEMLGHLSWLMAPPYRADE